MLSNLFENKKNVLSIQKVFIHLQRNLNEEKFD